MMTGGPAATVPQAPLQRATPRRTRVYPRSSVFSGRLSESLAKNLTLTIGHAAKFWPVFDTYQKQQNAIMDAQLKGLQCHPPVSAVAAGLRVLSSPLPCLVQGCGWPLL
jgi:hypothetical protein